MEGERVASSLIHASLQSTDEIWPKWQGERGGTEGGERETGLWAILPSGIKRSGWSGGILGMWLPLQATNLDSGTRDSWAKNIGEEERCVVMT